MSKKCKKCGKLNINPLVKYCSKNCLLADGGNMWGTQKKPIKQISEKKKIRLREQGSEVDVFEKINEVDKNCRVCGKHCEELTFTFPHILAKSSYPALRLIPANIARACSIEHHSEVDTKILVIKKDLEMLKKLKNAILKNDREEVRNLYFR